MSASFSCEFCEKTYTHNTNLRRHIRLHHEGPSSSSSFKCPTCNRFFSNRKEWHKHSHSNTEGVINDNVYCEYCKKFITKAIWHYHLRTNEHKLNSAEKTANHDDVKCIKSSFNKRINSYLIENMNKGDLIPENFLSNIAGKVLKLLNENTMKTNIKFNIELFCEYVLVKEDNDLCTIDIKSHQTKMYILDMNTRKEDVHALYDELCAIIIRKMSEFQERDSGWALIEISRLEININQYSCIKGSQYIPLPLNIKNKKACINVKNNDVFCFKWAIISALYPADDEHRDRCSSYKVNNIADEIIVLENDVILNFSGLNFPLAVSNIKDFEKNNAISVNVFGLEDDIVVGPYYFTQQEKFQHINLLLLEDGERFHYIWIKNISR